MFYIETIKLDFMVSLYMAKEPMILWELTLSLEIILVIKLFFPINIGYSTSIIASPTILERLAEDMVKMIGCGTMPCVTHNFGLMEFILIHVY